MVSKPERTKNKYGGLPTRTLVVNAIEAMGGVATCAQVDGYLINKYPGYKNSTYTNLIVNCVNCNRSNWSFNKTPRRTDDTTHRHHGYDRLFKRGSIFEIYNPAIHGVWELYQDSQGKWTFREIIVAFEKFSIEINQASQLISEQRLAVLVATSKTPELMMVTTREFKRNSYVVAEVLFRADGKCQYCKRDAPFKREDGTPFLEVHHIEWLSRGGEDSVENAIALCPNCHRQAHYGKLELTPVNKQSGG